MRGPPRFSVFLALSIILAFVASCDAPDKKWVSDTTGVSFVIPGDHRWKVQPPEGVSKISFSSKNGLVSYQEMEQNGPATVTQRGAEAWEARHFKRSLGTKVSGSMITF